MRRRVSIRGCVCPSVRRRSLTPIQKCVPSASQGHYWQYWFLEPLHLYLTTDFVLAPTDEPFMVSDIISEIPAGGKIAKLQCLTAKKLELRINQERNSSNIKTTWKCTLNFVTSSVLLAAALLAINYQEHITNWPDDFNAFLPYRSQCYSLVSMSGLLPSVFYKDQQKKF